MTLPFAYTPVLQAQAELGLSARLQQIAKVVAVAGIAEEDIVGITHKRVIGLHKMIRLGLLFTRLDLIYSTFFQRLTLTFLFGQIIKIALVTIL